MTTTPTNTNTNSRRIGLIIGASLLALLLAGTGSYMGLTHIRGQHVTQCQQANTTYTTAVTALTSSRDQLKKLADSTSEDSVADKAVLTTAVKLVKDTNPSTSLETCDTIGLFDFDTSRFTDRQKDADQFAKRGQELTNAGKAITASVELKKINDVKATAQTALEQANSLLASSNGKVADENTRTTLKNNIDNLTAVMAKNGVTVDEITTAMKAVTDASSAVNASVDAKTQADQAAAAQAAQAAQAQRRNTRNNRGGGNTYRGNRGSSSSNSGGGSTGGGSYDFQAELDRIHREHGPSQCSLEGTCHLALG